MTTQANFIALVNTKIDQAFKMFDIHLSHHDVKVTLDVKGKAAGWASRKGGILMLRFNPEAISKYWDHMVNNTIPHEIAHLVCFERRELGNNHDRGWKKVCRMLGGDDSRTHSMQLTPSRVKTKFDYMVAVDRVIKVGSTVHKRLQQGSTSYRTRDGIKIQASMWMRSTNTPPRVDSRVKTVSTTSTMTKAELVKQVISSNIDRSSAEIINCIMSQCNMTKAGASTYYYKYR